ncbi:TPA: phage antirepressor N-terminal domain-containing protein [Citrobacter freundii]|nr:phage antirepressor Ant [Citrobacter freundii]
MTSIAILEAVNTSYVPFNGQHIIAVMAAGATYVAMRKIVENIGIDWTGQSVKLRKQKEKFGCRDISIPSKGGVQKMLCIPMKKLNGWLFSINPEKVRADIRDKLIQYQEECFTVLHDYWAKGNAENPRKKTTVDDRTPLRDAVNMLVSKKRLMYPEAYAMIHQRFNVESIEDLEASQIQQAIEYVHRVVIEGEFIGKMQDVIEKSPSITDKEMVHLAWLWDYANRSQALFREVLPAMKQMQSQYSGRFFDHANEFGYSIETCRRILESATAHINIDRDSIDTNPTVLTRLRANTLPARYQ